MLEWVDHSEPTRLDMTTPRDNLRWALSALELVTNGLRSRDFGLDDTEMLNIKAAQVSVYEALKLIRNSNK